MLMNAPAYCWNRIRNLGFSFLYRYPKVQPMACTKNAIQLVRWSHLPCKPSRHAAEGLTSSNPVYPPANAIKGMYCDRYTSVLLKHVENKDALLYLHLVTNFHLHQLVFDMQIIPCMQCLHTSLGSILTYVHHLPRCSKAGVVCICKLSSCRIGSWLENDF
jgi:hypothetical protein